MNNGANRVRELREPITAPTWPGMCDLRDIPTEFEEVGDGFHVRCLACGQVLDVPNPPRGDIR